MSDENQIEVTDESHKAWMQLVEQAVEKRESMGRQDRETKLRHQFQGKWDERERQHELDLTELHTRKKELECELDRVNRELHAARQDAGVIHARQSEMILRAHEENQDLRNQVRVGREKLMTMEGMIRDIRMIIVSWENEGGNQHE